MVAGCGPKIAKLFLFIFNFCLWLCGVVLIGGGSYVAAKHNDYEDLFADNAILTVSWIAIGIGLFIFVVGFSGCCGAMKESSCLLKLYFFFVLLIVLAEGSLGIVTFVFSGDIEDSMTKGMQESINENYGLKEGTTEVIDDVQKTFDCCGAAGYGDYKTSKHLQEGLAVPGSCCKEPGCDTSGPKGNPYNQRAIWTEGCVHATKDTIKNHYLAIGGAAFGLLIFEIITMVFACCVIKGIDNGYEKYA
ncbi:CD63 antigen-like [Lytechinus variegatus]|uniref:CD63 antigen-like n=1 Tax=Lytechinus variegatus TaxID=7654 RepID=UPI001BB2CCD1|nr:CD63 antigen-like [Lytechinus variegatus]